MNTFLLDELQRVFPVEKRKDISKEDIKKWVRKTRLKQLLFILFESVILLGFGLGNLMTHPVKSFSFALGVLCLVVWPFLAINIHRYLKKLEYEEEDLDEILRSLRTGDPGADISDKAKTGE
ncbi:MAG: hypothetical protein K0B52_02385 [FCB group bacterium]|nr:hypothetical protein [FCB group bacterium]